jgi:hypothetical protein
LQNPNTAFTGVPSGRVIGGKAWKARKMNPDPSIRIRCSLRAVLSEASSLAGAAVSMSAVVASSWTQNVNP